MAKTRVMKKKSGASADNAINIDEDSDVSLGTESECDYGMESDTDQEIESSEDGKSKSNNSASSGDPIDFDFFPKLYLQMKEPWGPPSPESRPSTSAAGPVIRDYPKPVLRTPAKKPQRDLKLKKPYLKENSGKRRTRKIKISPMEKRLTKELKDLGVRLAALERQVLDNARVFMGCMQSIKEDVSQVGQGVERLEKRDV